MMLSFATCVGRAVLERMTVADDQRDAYLNAYILPAVWPNQQRHPWIVAAVFTLLELAVHTIAESAMCFKSTTQAQGQLTGDLLTQQVTLALFVYIAIVNSGFFVVTQQRIISVMKEVYKANTPMSYYLDALLRGLLFVGASFVFNVSVDGLFFSPNDGMSFIATTPSILFIVLLTDSGRIRKLVSELQRLSAPPAPFVVESHLL
ncbi:hypothetical protein DFJ73DRAFT_957291 [Zopfochytrium polystomum]|nr:hypothetical protein DFJ73DRAFT_957291 [Zopfochytrium polystomum]